MYWNLKERWSVMSERGLTLTWDVLKSFIAVSVNDSFKININMRCIEIFHAWRKAWNRSRLTLTWDVLKLPIPSKPFGWVID